MNENIEKRLQATQEVLFILTERADIQEQEIELLLLRVKRLEKLVADLSEPHALQLSNARDFSLALLSFYHKRGKK
ncbi:MAG: hypothetical protein ACR2MG_10605 [Pyrinomonadaceae bacterium]